MIYSDLQEILNANIDCFSFVRHNRKIDDLFPPLPIYSIPSKIPQNRLKKNELRISKTIKKFINRDKSG